MPLCEKVNQSKCNVSIVYACSDQGIVIQVVKGLSDPLLSFLDEKVVLWFASLVWNFKEYPSVLTEWEVNYDYPLKVHGKKLNGFNSSHS